MVWAWVGARDAAGNNQDFRWSDGSVLPKGGQLWGTGEPNRNDEQCVMVSAHFQYKLNDYGCTQLIASICQVDI